jgi:hypothetical protein
VEVHRDVRTGDARRKRHEATEAWPVGPPASGSPCAPLAHRARRFSADISGNAHPFVTGLALVDGLIHEYEAAEQ